MTPLVLAAREGPITVLTLNRESRHNSFIPELLEELLSAVETIQQNHETHAVLLLGNGRSFSTGGDLQGFVDHIADIQAYTKNLVGLLNRVILGLFDLPVPVVAGVHGPVTGGALGLVLAADVVLVTPEASFTPYYSTVGFSPDGGWTALLPWVIGPKRSAEILYCNRTITPSQAVDWGLASRIVSREALYDEARQVCREIAAGHPGSQRRTRELLHPTGLAGRLTAELDNFAAQIGEATTQTRMFEFLGRM